MVGCQKTLSLKHKQLMEPILRCLAETKEPLNVEGVRCRIGKSRGTSMNIRAILIHLEKQGRVQAKMVDGATHYTLRKDGAQPDMKELSKELGVQLEWICRGSTYLLRVSRGGNSSASFALPLGALPSSASESWVRERVRRGKELLDQIPKNSVPAPPPPPPSHFIPPEFMKEGAVARWKGRYEVP